jgi:hypothetical protein
MGIQAELHYTVSYRRGTSGIHTFTEEREQTMEGGLSELAGLLGSPKLREPNADGSFANS